MPTWKSDQVPSNSHSKNNLTSTQLCPAPVPSSCLMSTKFIISMASPMLEVAARLHELNIDGMMSGWRK